MARKASRRLTPLLLALSLGSTSFDVVGSLGIGAAKAQTQRQGSMQLMLRRQPKALEVVLEGVGEKPELQQRINGLVWEARLLTKGKPGLLRGPQRLSVPELGIESVSLNGGGNSYRIVVSAADGQAIADPVVTADGRNLILTFSGLKTPQRQTGRLDLNTPGRVPQQRYAPPLRARAVAPPLGDMAVGTMVLQSRSYLNLSGPMLSGVNFPNTDAKLALRGLAQQGGYGFVYSDSGAGAKSKATPADMESEKKITVYLNQVSFSKAFNAVLLASGYQARLEGKTIIVGPNVMNLSMGPTMSKVFRLNQVGVDGAIKYLGNLGAKIQLANTTTTTSRESESKGTSTDNSSSSTTSTTSTVQSESFGADEGPLKGLIGTGDSRLNTITLVGDPRLIAVAEGYLKNIDLRKRQVAVKVQILNVDLTNDRSIDSSFSARIGNAFLVNESGQAFMNFGRYRPGTSAGTGRLFNNSPYVEPGQYSAGVPQVEASNVVDPPAVEAKQFVNKTTTIGGVTTITQELQPKLDALGRPVYVDSTDPAAQPQLVKRVDANGLPIYVPGKDPNRFEYPKNSFYGYLEAAIVSSSAKTLAQPTLLVQEGETADVRTGTSVITSVDSTDTANGSTQFSYKRQNAGLELKVSVDKIDDNGFITLDLSPEVSVPVPAGSNGGVDIYNIESRTLNSGKIRLRDRQTLVLTGVIQENEKELVRKWPILGDLPFIGQLFRSSVNDRSKNELVILVTPSIIDDESGGSFGYGYRPSTKEARQLMGPR